MQSKNYLQQSAVAAGHSNQPILTLTTNEVIQKKEQALEEKTEKIAPNAYTVSYGGWMGYRKGYQGL